MKRTIAFGVALLFGTIVYAQTTGPKVGWDYLDANLTAGNVTEFQIQYDNGAWTTVGIPTDTLAITGGKTYFTPLTNLTGPHTVSVRACNATLCSDPLGPLAYVKPPKGANIIIIGGK